MDNWNSGNKIVKLRRNVMYNKFTHRNTKQNMSEDYHRTAVAKNM